MQTVDWQRVRADLRWGMRCGAIYAVCMLAWLGLAFALGGNSGLAQYGTTLGPMAAIDIAAGLVGGAIVGLLRPIARSPVGGFVIGVIAVAPCAAAMLVSASDAGSVGPRDIAIVSVLAGGPSGFLIALRAKHRARGASRHN